MTTSLTPNERLRLDLLIASLNAIKKQDHFKNEILWALTRMIELDAGWKKMLGERIKQLQAIDEFERGCG